MRDRRERQTAALTAGCLGRAERALPERSGAGTHRAVSASLRVFSALNMARWFAGTRSAKAAQSTALRAALRPAMAPPGPGDTGG